MSSVLADQKTPGDEPPPIASADCLEDSHPVRFAVLLVEDNRADVLIIEEAIALHGLPVELRVLSDGAEAFEFIERADRDSTPCPQLLVLDLNLPKRSGKEVLQRVRESAKFKDIPVLVMTSSNSARDRNDMRQLAGQCRQIINLNQSESCLLKIATRTQASSRKRSRAGNIIVT
jgi:CheY-like chemotaxis protein